MKKAVKTYRDFHGREVDVIERINFHVPSKGITYLGEAVAIEYLSDKFNGGGDGKKAIYRHKFAKGDKLACSQDPRTKKWQLYIIGPKLKVTDRGIEY